MIATILALFFAGWAMRGANTTEITLFDQARHAMNGVALFDMVREGKEWHAIGYLREYFGHLPSLSMPYHPPLFPAVEALFYAAFGVSVWTARVAVAAFVAVDVLLMFRIVLALERNCYVAISSTLIFFALPMTQLLSADVMLELPALSFVLGAITFMTTVGPEWSARYAIFAGLSAGAGVWTKQTLFVGLVPLAILAARGQLRKIPPRPFILFYSLFGFLAGCFLALDYLAGFSGVSKDWTQVSVPDRILQGVQFYTSSIGRQLGSLSIVATGAVVATLVWWRRRSVIQGGGVVYLSWIASCAAVLLVAPVRDDRYAWFAYPPVVVLITATVHATFRRVAGAIWANAAVAALGIGAFVWYSGTQPRYLTGTLTAATQIGTGGRILYCGASNGSFVFSVRERDPERTTYVVRADKVVDLLRSLGLPEFVRRYGIASIVSEVNQASSDCNDFNYYTQRAFPAYSNVPLRSNMTDYKGNLHIHFVHGGDPSSGKPLDLGIKSTGGVIQLDFRNRN